MDKRSPVEEGRTSSADLKQEYSAIARLSKTSAQSARVIPQVQLVTQNVFNLFTVLIFVFLVVGHKNHKVWDLAKFPAIR